MPHAYRDTRYGDDPDEKTFTIGTDDAKQLKAEHTYWYWYRGRRTNVTSDRAHIRGQRGYRKHEPWCYVKGPEWCVFTRPGLTQTFIPRWEHQVPGSDTWRVD